MKIPTRHITHTRPDQGYLIVMAMVFVIALLGIGVSIAAVVGARYRVDKNYTYTENAVSAAEAGISAAIYNLNATGGYFTGYATPQAFPIGSDTSRGEYTVSIADNADGTSTLTSVGKVYRTTSDTTPASTKTLKAIATPTMTTVAAGMVAGPGGLTLGTMADINTKNIYIQGKLSLQGGIIGKPTANPTTTINVANIACGTGASYPQPCPANQEPISLGFSTSIYGTVCATNQYTSVVPPFSGIYPDTNGLGLIDRCVAPSASLPTFDRKVVYDGTAGNIQPGGAFKDFFYCALNREYNFPANVRYTSSVTTDNNFCAYNIHGNMYIKGDFNTNFGNQLIVDESLTTPPIIMVEGAINLSNTAIHKNNSHGVGVIFISFKSANATCNTDPDCVSISNNDLYNSINTTTASCTGGFCNLDGSVLYSAFGTVDASGGCVSGLGGQRITVGFGTTIQCSVNISPFPGGDAFGGRVKIKVWKVTDVQQVYS